MAPLSRGFLLNDALTQKQIQKTPRVTQAPVFPQPARLVRASRRGLTLVECLNRRHLGGVRLFAAERLHWVHGRGLARWEVTRSHGRPSDERPRCDVCEWIKRRDAK